MSNTLPTVFIIDDEGQNISIMNEALAGSYNVKFALQAKKALEIFESEFTPDIIIVDLLMPDMNGIEFLNTIKQIDKLKNIPVLMLTSSTNYSDELAAFNAGAADFISKPLRPLLIRKRLDLQLQLHQKILAERKEGQELKKVNDYLQQDQLFAKEMYDKFLVPEFLSKDFIKYVLKPYDVFGGDVILSNLTPAKTLQVLIGDFTGHGLSAAVGILPTAEMFYNLSSNGCSLPVIVKKLNQRLNEVLPTCFFCAAAILEIHIENSLMFYWAGWFPDSYILDIDNQIIKTISPNSTGLGLMDKSTFDFSVQKIDIAKNQKLLLFSDGLPEIANNRDERLEMERLIPAIVSTPKDKNLPEVLLEFAEDFAGEAGPGDDISILEIDFQKLLMHISRMDDY